MSTFETLPDSLAKADLSTIDFPTWFQVMGSSSPMKFQVVETVNDSSSEDLVLENRNRTIRRWRRREQWGNRNASDIAISKSEQRVIWGYGANKMDGPTNRCPASTPLHVEPVNSIDYWRRYIGFEIRRKQRTKSSLYEKLATIRQIETYNNIRKTIGLRKLTPRMEHL